MSNANSSTVTIPIILTRIEVYCKADGSYHANAFTGSWHGNEEGVKQVETFARGNHRVKVCVYGRMIGNLREFGVWLCKTLIDRDETVWRRVELSNCDR